MKESFAPPDVVFDVVVVAVSAFRKGRSRRASWWWTWCPFRTRYRGWLAVVFFPNARCGHAGSDAGDARTPGSNARARARTMQRPERSDATRSDAV